MKRKLHVKGMKSIESIKQICGYDWIIQGWNNIFM